MFGLSFTDGDLKRVIWTLLEAGFAVVIAAAIGWVNGAAWDWRALGVGVLAAVLAAAKNLILTDTSRWK